MKRLIFAIAVILILVSLFPSSTPAADSRQDPQTTPTDQACMACEDTSLLPGRVEAVLFWMDGCPHCHDVLDNVLTPLEERYGDQLEILLVEIATQEDIDRLFEVAAAYGIPREQVGVPFLVIGDRALIGSGQIPTEFPRLIEAHLSGGGISVPEIAAVQSFLATNGRKIFQNQDNTPGVTQTPASTPAPASTPTIISNAASNEGITRDGFALAVGAMVVMVAAIIISLSSVITGKTYLLPSWIDWLIPVLILVGIVIAGYLSYVETQLVQAVCGPVGDCNTVQSSPYARLLGVLPVGVFGLLGYFGLLAAWVVRRLQPEWEHKMNLVFWVLVFFATVFSLYLTYLEPFVIHAVCMWCLSSALVVTLLLLLGTPGAAVSLKELGRG